MLAESGRMTKRLRTLAAFKWLFAAVLSFVTAELAGQTERLLTNVAHVWFKSGVYGLPVSLKYTQLRERLATLFTFVRFIAGMNASMHGELAQVTE